MSDPNVLEMETAPATLNYRKQRLAVWKQIKQRYDAYVVSARNHGATPEQAEAAAGRDVRGQVRWLVGELLAHAQGHDAASFVIAASREWGSHAEILLNADPVVPDLIGHTYPVPSWAATLEYLPLALGVVSVGATAVALSILLRGR